MPLWLGRRVVLFLGLVALVYLVVPVLIVSSVRHRRTGTGRRLSVNHLVFWTLVALTVLPGTYDVLRMDFGDSFADELSSKLDALVESLVK